MRPLPLVALLALIAACTPAETVRSVVVRKTDAADATEAIIRTTADLSPGDYVQLWRHCYRGRCSEAEPRLGLVKEVVPDSPDYAVVIFAPGANVQVGNRAVRVTPMSYWHPERPR